MAQINAPLCRTPEIGEILWAHSVIEGKPLWHWVKITRVWPAVVEYVDVYGTVHRTHVANLREL